jgi:hypothetical protein
MKKLNKVFIVGILACGIVLGAWIDSTRTKNAYASYSPKVMRDYWPAPMPKYPMSKEFPLSQKMSVSNANMKMSWFKSSDEPLDIAKFYAGIWKRAGHYVEKNIHPLGGKVSSYEPRTGLQRQIILNKKGKITTVYVSLIMGQFKASNSSEDTVLPIYPGAEGIIKTGSRDKLSDSNIISYVDREDVYNNVLFYKRSMIARGYKYAEEQKNLTKVANQLNSNIKHLIFKKGNEEVSITISPLKGSKRTRVVMTRMIGKGQ